MPSIQRTWLGRDWFGTRRSVVLIHSPRPILLWPATYGISEDQRASGAEPGSRSFVWNDWTASKNNRAYALHRSSSIFGFCVCFPGTASSGAEKANALPGGRTAPSRSRRQGRAVGVHWSEAKVGAGFCYKLDARSTNIRQACGWKIECSKSRELKRTSKGSAMAWRAINLGVRKGFRFGGEIL